MANNLKTMHRVVNDEITALKQVAKEIDQDSESIKKYLNYY